jgi:hypothetical protein
LVCRKGEAVPSLGVVQPASLLFADVLVPHLRMGNNILSEHRNAFGGIQVNDLDAY